MGNMKYCKSCGKLFDGFREICTACIRKDEDFFVKIKRFVDVNPNTTVSEISDMLSIDEDVIVEMIRDGRLKLAEHRVSLTCQKCGAPIKGGRMCDKCIIDLKTVSESLARAQANSVQGDQKKTSAFLQDLKERR